MRYDTKNGKLSYDHKIACTCVIVVKGFPGLR
jgi:hypothetical protein